MAKYYTDAADIFHNVPAVIPRLINVGSGDVDFPFFVIMIGFNSIDALAGDKILFTAGADPIDPFSVTPSEAQLGLARALIQNPDLIADGDFFVHWHVRQNHIRWNTTRGKLSYGIPACAYDGDWYSPHWTPDLWPPVYPI